MGSVLVFALAAVLVAVGLAGLVLPGLPGAPLLFAGLLVAAWAEHFAYVGAGTLVVLAILAAATWGVDFAASAFGARRFGASGRAVAGAALGGLVGIFFGLPGLVVGPFVGATAGELSAQRGLRQAGWAGIGATLGMALGLAGKLALGISMLGVFAFDRFVWR
jgi:uncharacterized protein YqgC (DUF456 family)